MYHLKVRLTQSWLVFTKYYYSAETPRRPWPRRPWLQGRPQQGVHARPLGGAGGSHETLGQGRRGRPAGAGARAVQHGAVGARGKEARSLLQMVWPIARHAPRTSLVLPPALCWPMLKSRDGARPWCVCGAWWWRAQLTNTRLALGTGLAPLAGPGRGASPTAPRCNV